MNLMVALTLPPEPHLDNMRPLVWRMDSQSHTQYSQKNLRMSRYDAVDWMAMFMIFVFFFFFHSFVLIGHNSDHKFSRWIGIFFFFSVSNFEEMN